MPSKNKLKREKRQPRESDSATMDRAGNVNRRAMSPPEPEQSHEPSDTEIEGAKLRENRHERRS
jgi:hypothetical protein